MRLVSIFYIPVKQFTIKIVVLCLFIISHTSFAQISYNSDCGFLGCKTNVEINNNENTIIITPSDCNKTNTIISGTGAVNSPAALYLAQKAINNCDKAEKRLNVDKTIKLNKIYINYASIKEFVGVL